MEKSLKVKLGDLFKKHTARKNKEYSIASCCFEVLEKPELETNSTGVKETNRRIDTKEKIPYGLSYEEFR